MRRVVNGSDIVLFGDRKNTLGWSRKYNWRPSGNTQWTVKISRETNPFAKSPRIDLKNASQRSGRKDHAVRDEGTRLADQSWRWTTANRSWQLSTSGYRYGWRSGTSGHENTQTWHFDSYQNYAEAAQFSSKWNLKFFKRVKTKFFYYHEIKNNFELNDKLIDINFQLIIKNNETK